MKYLFLLLLLPSVSLADSATDRTDGFFMGGGFGMGQSLLDGGNGSTPAKFQDFNWALEAGLTAAMSGSRLGAQVSGEYGQYAATNSYSSSNFMESGNVDYYGAKAGLFYGPVTFGYGYRHNEAKIKSLTATPNISLESDYAGWNGFYFADYTLNVGKRFRTSIEGQYLAGKLTGVQPSTGSVQIKQTTVNLRFYFTF